MAESSSSSFQLKVNQPKKFSFPSRSFGKKGEKRSFKSSWFETWSWLTYIEGSDSVLCFYCSEAKNKKLLPEDHSKTDPAFISTGFTNWKDACSRFKKHQLSRYHVDAVYAITGSQKNIGDLINKAHKEEKEYNGRMLMNIIQNIQFLGRQGLAIQGHEECESNFIQLMKLRSHDQSDIKQWLERKHGDKYTSPEIQNEILHLMSNTILRDIVKSIQHAEFFSIMADECVDTSNQEQLALCFRHVDADFDVHESFMGLYQCPDITANTLVKVIKDALLRFNLDITRCRGQCYDGGSNMAGKKNGVKAQILKEEPCALFTHCYGHTLSLSVGDTVKKIKLLQSSMDTTFEISKLLQYSPKRRALFETIKADISPDSIGFRVLCPTRWTVRNETFKSILDNYNVILELWEDILDNNPDSETRARVNGVASQMQRYDYFFGARLLHSVLRHTDNLSKTMQHTRMSACEAQSITKMTVSTLQFMRSDENFKLCFERSTQEANIHDIEQPVLPRKRKVPRRFDSNNDSGTTPATPEDYYRAIYFETLDMVINCIKDRYNQEGYIIYSKFEMLLLKGNQQDQNYASYDDIFELYQRDILKDDFLAQLQMFHTNYHIDAGMNLLSIVNLVKGMSGAERSLYSQIVKVTRLLLVIPATNAISERSFSAMRRIKNYLRSTMNQKRLNALMMVNVHKQLTDTLDLCYIANEFCNSDYRRNKFPKF